MNLKRSLRRDGAFDPEYLCWMFDNACEWLDGYIQGRLMKAEDAQLELETLLGIHGEPDTDEELMLLRLKLTRAVQQGAPNEAAVRGR